MNESEINLTVIGDRSCSTTRTYLTYMKNAGFRPRNLWLVDFGKRLTIIGLLQNVINNMRRKLSYTQNVDEDYRALCLKLQNEAGFEPIDYFAPWEPQKFATKIVHLFASDFSDTVLQRRILKMQGTAFLYTNGGIVPSNLLDKPEIKIIHVHPGIVPEFRGSDCLLWSAYVRRRIGVSCIYMSSGIDEGPVISQNEYDLPHLPSASKLLEEGREPQLYRALLFAIDPHYRASLLIEVLKQFHGIDIRYLPSVEQPHTQRPAYLWMHPRLRARIIRDVFL